MHTPRRVRGFFIGYSQDAAGLQLGGYWGESRYSFLPLPALICLRSGKLFVEQLEKLKAIAAQENRLVKHELEIRGHDLTFWSKPLTIDEFNAAKAAAKNGNDLEVSARLFVNKALDQGGQRQYAANALPVIMRLLSMSTAAKLLGELNKDIEDMEALDMKSPSEGVEEG